MATKLKQDLSAAISASRALVVATEGFEKVMRALEHDIDPLDDDEFWAMVELYRVQVMKGFYASQDAEANAQNLQCNMAEKGEAKAVKFIRFAKAWGEKKSAAYRSLFDTIQDRGDDGYGDLIDSLPFVGRDVFEKALSGYFGNEAAIKDAAREALREAVTANTASKYRSDEENAASVEKALKQLLSHVFRGENYNEMSLTNEGREIFRWTMSPIACKGEDCDDGVSPVVGVDKEGKCRFCSLDDEYIAHCKSVRWY